MIIYNELMKLNRKEVFHEAICDIEINNAIEIFINGVYKSEDIALYKKRMRVDPKEDSVYPIFYIPPYLAKRKLRLIQGYLPKTNILYANHYELEVIRLLKIHSDDNPIVIEMVDKTLERLQKICYNEFI